MQHGPNLEANTARGKPMMKENCTHHMLQLRVGSYFTGGGQAEDDGGHNLRDGASGSICVLRVPRSAARRARPTPAPPRTLRATRNPTARPSRGTEATGLHAVSRAHRNERTVLAIVEAPAPVRRDARRTGSSATPPRVRAPIRTPVAPPLQSQRQLAERKRYRIARRLASAQK